MGKSTSQSTPQSGTVREHGSAKDPTPTTPTELRDVIGTLGRDLAQPINLRDRFNDLLTLNLMALERLPESCRDIAVLRSALNTKLVLDFSANWLSDEERQQLPNYSAEAFLPRDSHEKWDRFIVEAAQQYGARLLLSDHVMARLWAWANGEKFGSRKLEKLFSTMHRSARIGLRQVRGTITDRHRRAKKFFVPELQVLQTRLRHAWPESPNEIRRLVAQNVETSPELRHLKANKEQLLRAFDDDKKALAFRGKPERSKDDLTPTKFCVEWMAGAENLSVEYVRQRLLTKKRPKNGLHGQ